jgi:RHS repeat-associated protein
MIPTALFSITRLRVFFGILLIAVVWMGMSSKSEAGYWTAPTCGGSDFRTEGDGAGSGCAAAAGWAACRVPTWTLGGCYSAHPNYVILPVWTGWVWAHTGATHRCYPDEMMSTGGKCVEKVPSKNSCPAGGNAQAGNPVEIGTGRKIQETVDWTSGGSVPLTFERSYSSIFEALAAPVHSRLGRGWRSNFDGRASYDFLAGVTNPTLAPSGSLIHIVLPDNNEYSFKLNGGIWKSVLPRPDPLDGAYWDTYRTDLDVALTLTSDSVTIRTDTGRKYTFDLAGMLSRITDNTGYSQYLFYSGHLNTKVIDSFSREISFEYWTGNVKIGLLKSAIFGDGKKIQFDYVAPYSSSNLSVYKLDYSDYALSSVVYPDNTAATDADNPKLAYEYLQSIDFPYALTGIYNENAVKFASWTYDVKGRATSSQHSGGDGLTTFAYDDVNNKVTVTNALGKPTVYSFQKISGIMQRLIAVDGVATTNCAASNTAYAFDANGYKNQATDAEGRITKWVRNSRGLATSTTEGFGTPEARTRTTTWDATRPLPTQIAVPGMTTGFAYNAASQVTSLTQTDTTTTTQPYSTNGQARATAFNYTTLTLPAPPAIGPTGAPLADVSLTLANPDAETGTTVGWTNTTGAIAVQTTTPCNVSKCFNGGVVASSVAHQDIAVPALNTAEVDSGLRAARVSWKQNSLNNSDRANMRLVFLDQAGAVIGSAVDNLRAEVTWALRERTAPIPALTRTIRVQMMMERTAGTPNDGYIDDIALTLVADGTAADKPYLRPANPDALAGSTAGWTVSAGAVATQVTAPCVFFACFKDVNAGTDAFHQTITLPIDRIAEIDGLARGIDLQWVDRSTDVNNTLAVELNFLDSADQIMIDSTSASPILSSVNLWKQRIHYADVPAGARKVKIAVSFFQPVTFAGGGTFFTGLTARLVGRQVPQGSVDVLTSVDGPLAGAGDTVSYQYDTSGNITQVTNELGHVTQVTALNAIGQPLTTVDGNGVATNLAYDARGRLITVTENPGPSPAVTAIEYDLAGQVTKVTAPDGSFLAYTWNDAKRLTLVANNTGETIAYAYNANGDQTSSTVKASGGAITRQMTMAYDELGRLMRSIGAASQTTTIAYDRTDNPVTVTDPRSNLYSFAYDGLQRVMRETDQESSQVNLTRDGQDNVVAYADPRSLVTAYVRNGFGEVIRETSPDAGVTITVRDARGLATQVTDGRGIVTNMTYDTGGRLLSETYPASAAENVTYTYDSVAGGNKGVGRLTSVTDQSGSAALAYDALGRVASETRVIGARSYTTAYAYDAADHLTQITYPSGRIVTYARNSLGQVASVTTQQTALAANQNVATGVAWKPMSDLMASMAHGNGIATTAAYDLDYRLASLMVQDGATNISSLAYAYGDGMNLTAITDNLAPASSVSLGYSPANRLAQANGQWGNMSLAYDGVGNRLSQSTTLAAVTTTRLSSYDGLSNRITGMTENSAALRSYAYDGAGNIVSDTRPGEVFAFSYNARNRPASVTRNSVAYASYSYNAFEQLVARSTTAPGGPSGTVHYIHDLDGHIIAEADAATGSITRDYIWMAANDNTPTDLPLAVAEASSLYQVHTDHLGRPTRMTDAAKASVWQAAYNPHGEAAGLSGAISNNLRFPGQVFQIETGLAYNWHRHYDATTGRYTQADPLRFVDGPSIYAYAGNSPLMYTDREGRYSRCPPGADKYMPGCGRVGPEMGGGGANRGGGPGAEVIIYAACAAAYDYLFGGNDPPPPSSDDDDDDKCEQQAQRDEQMCRMATLPKTGARARCWESVSERYGACRAGRPLPPLVVW